MAQMETHEPIRRDHEVRGSSDRSFGFVFAALFAIVGAWPLVRGGEPRVWPLAVAAVLLAIALARPNLLAPLNRLWFRFGLLLNRIVSPLVMGLVFFVALVPTALVMKVMRKDPLRLRLDPEAASYWIDRTPPGPAPESMKNQF